ncbi:hypothetical protein JCM10213v2_006761 [Rhodosporidiobolus nylandii]
MDDSTFWARVASLNLPPHVLAFARADAAARRRLEEQLAQTTAPEGQQDVAAGWPPHMRQVVLAAKRQSEQEKTAAPQNPPMWDRKLVVAEVHKERSSRMMYDQSGFPSNPVLLMGAGATFSTSELSQLKRISDYGISFAVEDLAGRSERLSLCHYPLHGVKTEPDLDALFPLGQILAVQEPTVKTNQDGSGVSVCVDSPTDLVFLQLNNPLVKSVPWTFPYPAKPLQPSFDHKTHGNNLFKQKRYLSAVKAYSEGLSASPSDEATLLLHLNRAQAHLFLGNHGSAYRESSAVLSLFGEGVDASPQTRLKAKLRRARALEGMRLLEKAKAAYEAVLELESSSAEGKEGVGRIEGMLRLSRTGKFDWEKLEDEAEKARAEGRKPAVIAAGTFVGPIKVAKMKERNGGRGVVTTRAVKAGELLLAPLLGHGSDAVLTGLSYVVAVEEPFAVGYRQPNNLDVALVYDLRGQRENALEEYLLADAVMARMLDDPSTASFVYSLHGGDDFPPTSTASFGSFEKRTPICEKPVHIDPERIEAIAVLNCHDSEDEQHDPSAQLFLHASLFNHSCLPNAIFSDTGVELMIIRARQPIPAGAEVNIAYITGAAPSSRQDAVFELQFGPARCPCDYHEWCRRAGPERVNRRFRILKQQVDKTADPLIQASRAVKVAKKDELVSYVTAMEQTYLPATPRGVRSEMKKPYIALAEFCETATAAGRTEGIIWALKALEASGAVFQVKKRKVKIVAVPCPTQQSVLLFFDVARRFYFEGPG